MHQLLLSQHELEHIGFTAKYVPSNDDTVSSVWYTMPVANGEFLYNPDTVPYKWYFRSSDVDVSNLSIQIVQELYVLLSCFNAGYRMLNQGNIEYEEE